EPRVDDEEADMQRVLEESLKSIYDAPRGPLPSVVIMEPESGKSQPLPEVQGKGKVRTSTPTRSSGHDESSSLYAEIGLMDSEVEFDEDVSRIDVGVQGFTAMAYPNAQENLKLTVEEQVILEEPAISTGSLSSLQHLTKDLSFGDLFFNDKPLKADNEKTTAETEAESMVSVAIQLDTSSIPPMTTPHISELEHTMANLIQENKHLEERLDNHRARLYTLENLDIPHQVSKAVDEIVTDAVDWAIQAPLQNHFRDVPEAYMKEILHQRMWETNSYKTHKDHMMIYEALEKSMNRDHFEELAKDLAEARKKKKKRHDSPKTPPESPPHHPSPPPPPAGLFGASGSPGASGSSQVPPPPPPPPSTNQEGQSHGSTTPSSSKTDASSEYQAWTMTNTRLRPSVSLTLADLKTSGNHLRTILSFDVPVPKNLQQDLLHQNLPGLFPKNNWASALVSTYSPPLEDSLLANNVNKPLPLGGPLGQVTIQSDFFFNNDLEYLRYGSKGNRPVLSISKMKATYYPDVGLEQIVPDQMWIEEECKYDIAAIYGISHWWFQRQQFYINRYTSKGDCRAIRTHMQILSVVRIEVFSKYWLPEPPATQRQEDSYYCRQLIDHTLGFEYKHDYTVIDSLRAVTFRDRYEVQMIMRFNKIHKFSDDTLQQIDEALDYRVKEFKVNRMNPGLNIRFWTRKDVDKSKEFMFAIQKQLKTMRIFYNLESFVGGRVTDGDYRLLKRTE
nr:hypothetical protein [Tanacetum cinerariifolium]